MAPVLLAVALLVAAAWLVRKVSLRRRRRQRSDARAERQRRRILHWRFLDRLFGERHKRLTYRDRDELAD